MFIGRDAVSSSRPTSPTGSLPLLGALCTTTAKESVSSSQSSSVLEVSSSSSMAAATAAAGSGCAVRRVGPVVGVGGNVGEPQESHSRESSTLDAATLNSNSSPPFASGEQIESPIFMLSEPASTSDDSIAGGEYSAGACGLLDPPLFTPALVSHRQQQQRHHQQRQQQQQQLSGAEVTDAAVGFSVGQQAEVARGRERPTTTATSAILVAEAALKATAELDPFAVSSDGGDGGEGGGDDSRPVSAEIWGAYGPLRDTSPSLSPGVSSESATSINDDDGNVDQEEDVTELSEDAASSGASSGFPPAVMMRVAGATWESGGRDGDGGGDGDGGVCTSPGALPPPEKGREKGAELGELSERRGGGEGRITGDVIDDGDLDEDDNDGDDDEDDDESSAVAGTVAAAVAAGLVAAEERRTSTSPIRQLQQGRNTGNSGGGGGGEGDGHGISALRNTWQGVVGYRASWFALCFRGSCCCRCCYSCCCSYRRCCCFGGDVVAIVDVTSNVDLCEDVWHAKLWLVKALQQCSLFGCRWSRYDSAGVRTGVA